MASYQTASHWLVSVPNELGSAKAAMDRFRSAMVETTGRTHADLCAFDVPMLKVGTLDILMSLSDDVARGDTFVEGVVKKVERQVAESYNAEKTAELLKNGKDVGPGSIEPLRMYVPGREGKPIPVYDWASTFKWDVNTWGDSSEPLPDILRRLLAAAEKIDQDIRAYAQAYQEKKTALVAAERKKSGNLMVASLEDIITPKILQDTGAEMIPADSEYLQTVVVVVAKASEEAFLESYGHLDEQSVPLGPEGRRDAVRGSPVVPGSARRIAEDKDGYVLYTVVILKKFADSFRSACREKRFSVREFAYEPSNSGAVGRQVTELQQDTAVALAQLKTESRRKYGEIINIWFHIKAVRIFVESVLRYGLPVNFQAILFRIQKSAGGSAQHHAEQANKLLHSVRNGWKTITGGTSIFDDAFGGSAPGSKEAKNAGPEMVIPGVSDSAGSGSSSQPFVFLDFEIKADTAASGAK